MSRFDIVEGHWCYYVSWHGGQFSREYRRLSGMSRYFSPRFNLGVETLEEDGREVYLALVRRYQGDIAYMKERNELEAG